MVELAVDSGQRSTERLVAGDTEPWIVLNPGAPSPFLLLGDHAGRAIPQSLGDLGLPAAERVRHIAWDIGVAGYGAHLSELLDATFIHQRFSRLVIDCNRDPARPDAIPAISDGAEIPGNADLSAADRQARFDAISAPYHARIAAQLDAWAALGKPTTLIALHSFTPAMAGFARPWEFGVLHAGDSVFSAAVLMRLQAQFGLDVVGDNQPYRMDEVDYTIPYHCRPRALDYLELEVRQDLVADAAGQRRVAERLAPILLAALGDIGAAV